MNLGKVTNALRYVNGGTSTTRAPLPTPVHPMCARMAGFAQQDFDPADERPADEKPAVAVAAAALNVDVWTTGVPAADGWYIVGSVVTNYASDQHIALCEGGRWIHFQGLHDRAHIGSNFSRADEVKRKWLRSATPQEIGVEQ